MRGSHASGRSASQTELLIAHWNISPSYTVKDEVDILSDAWKQKALQIYTAANIILDYHQNPSVFMCSSANGVCLRQWLWTNVSQGCRATETANPGAKPEWRQVGRRVLDLGFGIFGIQSYQSVPIKSSKITRHSLKPKLQTKLVESKTHHKHTSLKASNEKQPQNTHFSILFPNPAPFAVICLGALPCRKNHESWRF